jgi:hypothetical protein
MNPTNPFQTDPSHTNLPFTNSPSTKSSPTKSSPADSVPIDEHPNDPDRDFNEREENYLHEVVKRLKKIHTNNMILRLNARTQLARAQEEEREMWLSFETYITKAALWHQKQTGEDQLRVPHGILNVIEETAPPKVTDPAALKGWVQSLLSALLPLAEATSRIPAPHREPEKPPCPATAVSDNKSSIQEVEGQEVETYHPIFDPYWPWEESDIDHSFVGAERRPISPLERAVAAFHAATGILPAGCQPGETRTVVRLG